MMEASQAQDQPLRRSLKDQLVDTLGREIVSGRLEPGKVLPSEETLLVRYAVSRTVLREAFNVLGAKGLIGARPRIGTFVRPSSEWNQLDPAVLGWSAPTGPGAVAAGDAARLDQLMEVRRIVEPGAAALAARRGTQEDFAALRAAFAQMEAADVAEAFMRADLAFHVACLNAGHNDFLRPVAHAIRTAMMTSLRITNRDPHENRHVSLPLHHAILDAVLNRDAAGASAAMERHLDDTEARRRRARDASP
jgi:GntR family transcriptional regulator, galactonate operon transcriptional repressor